MQSGQKSAQISPSPPEKRMVAWYHGWLAAHKVDQDDSHLTSQQSAIIVIKRHVSDDMVGGMNSSKGCRYSHL